MRWPTLTLPLLALAALAACNRGEADYAPHFTAAMLPEGFGDVRPWDSTLREIIALYPDDQYRVTRIESGPVYHGPVLTASSRGDTPSLPLGARAVSYSFSLEGSVMRLMRIDVLQRSDNPTPVCDWLIETVGTMSGSEEGCLDEDVARGVRDNGARYCVGTADGVLRIDMDCGRAREGGYEHVLTVIVAEPE